MQDARLARARNPRQQVAGIGADLGARGVLVHLEAHRLELRRHVVRAQAFVP